MSAMFKCPQCGRESANPTDVIEGYCAACKDWTGVRLADVQVEDDIPVLGRLQTSLAVVDGRTVVMLTLYDVKATTEPAAYWQLDPEVGLYWAVAVAGACRSALEDQESHRG